MPGTMLQPDPTVDKVAFMVASFSHAKLWAGFYGQFFVRDTRSSFHYKCIRPLVENHHPAFSCPLCRTFADLDDDVEIEAEPVTDIEPAPDAIADHGEEDENVMVGVFAAQPVDDVSMADVVQVKYTVM